MDEVAGHPAPVNDPPAEHEEDETTQEEEEEEEEPEAEEVEEDEGDTDEGDSSVVQQLSGGEHRGDVEVEQPSWDTVEPHRRTVIRRPAPTWAEADGVVQVATVLMP